ncbi:MAG: type IV pilin-like G/H family protein [Cyanobium sp.]
MSMSARLRLRGTSRSGQCRQHRGPIASSLAPNRSAESIHPFPRPAGRTGGVIVHGSGVRNDRGAGIAGIQTGIGALWSRPEIRRCRCAPAYRIVAGKFGKVRLHRASVACPQGISSMKPFPSSVLSCGAAASGLLLGLAISGVDGARAQAPAQLGGSPVASPAIAPPLTPQPLSPSNPDQSAALQAVAKMTEGQRTYYQKNGRFRATISDIQRDFGITLPTSFNYAVRTTTEAAYSYVIPVQSTKTGQLKAYVGAAFLTPNQTPMITTIICQNLQPGQIRPADPQLALGTLVDNPKGRIVQCGNASVKVKASIVSE